MMVQDDTGRALWIDFDRAQTYTPGDITTWRREWFKDETEYVERSAEALAKDFKEGKINETYFPSYG